MLAPLTALAHVFIGDLTPQVRIGQSFLCQSALVDIGHFSLPGPLVGIILLVEL